jgi:chaperone required for assembly of F1-ATPase
MPPAADTSDRPRRFYAKAEPGPLEGGFGVLLDGRPSRTPGGKRLVLPTKPLASLVAAEWAGQGEIIDISRMAATRLAFSAADRIAARRGETAEAVGRYAGADLICYFADGPEALIDRQEAQWGPMLEWAREALGLRLARATGIVHQAQPEASIARAEALAAELDDFALAALAMAAGLFGSAVLAFALQRGRLTGVEAFELSRLDEQFQEEKWGVDAEAAARRALLTAEAEMLDRWFSALR